MLSRGCLLPPLQDIVHTGGGKEPTLNITGLTEFKLVKLLLRSEFLSVSQEDQGANFTPCHLKQYCSYCEQCCSACLGHFFGKNICSVLPQLLFPGKSCSGISGHLTVQMSSESSMCIPAATVCIMSFILLILVHSALANMICLVELLQG